MQRLPNGQETQPRIAPSSLSTDKDELYWARRGQVGISSVPEARWGGRTDSLGRAAGRRPPSPGPRRIDRELGSSLRSLAFMDDEDLNPFAKARMQRLETQVSQRQGETMMETRTLPHYANGPAAELQPLHVGGFGGGSMIRRDHQDAQESVNSSSQSGAATPSHLQHASFGRNDGSPVRNSHSPGHGASHTPSPKMRSALTSSLGETWLAGSPAQNIHLQPTVPASPIFKQPAPFHRSPVTHSRQTTGSSLSPHASPRLGKRTLSPLADESDQPAPSLIQIATQSSRRDSSVSSTSARFFLNGVANPQQVLPRPRQGSRTDSPGPPAAPSSQYVGVYRPPHLRHRNSGHGLISSIAHYDRVRTPSLRGQTRSRESSIAPTHRSSMSSSRPPSTVPISEDDDDTFDSPVGPSMHFSSPTAPSQSSGHTESPRPHPLTAEAVAKYLSSQQEQPATLPAMPPLNRSLTISSLASSHYADELQAKLDASLGRKTSPQPGHGGLDPTRRSSAYDFGSNGRRGSMYSEDLNDIELSAEDMMRSSLTDSYILSRNGSMASGMGGESVVDIFEVGDRLGPGMMHDGHLITIAETTSGFQSQEGDLTGSKLEVVRKLGEGSYACVYLAKEVSGDEGESGGTPKSEAVAEFESASMPLSSTPTASNTFARSMPRKSIGATTESGDVTVTDSGLSSTIKAGDSPLASRQAQEQQESLGRSFALKCLCKRDLSPQMLELQRLEATIHQSIPPHQNIVTLYRTYETPEWLFLVLEYCSGQDLYYWLEQAQDEMETPSMPPTPSTEAPSDDGFGSDSGGAESTPPEPSLLATTAGVSILSRRRLRLISRMFQQMCSAVQFCHDRGIAHRDLKPENFIVEDSRHEPADSEAPLSLSDSFREGDHKVKVKLTDFGLATADEMCDDFECGSKPYMSYECRNDVEPSYDPKQADVWSLGIVLLNMLFHRSPFKEPSVDRCPSFAAFREQPVQFLTEAFDGLTENVARFLAERVLCDVSAAERISAAEFGQWAIDLVEHMGLHDSTRASTPSKGAAMGITNALAHSRSRSSLRSPISASLFPSLQTTPGLSTPVEETFSPTGLSSATDSIPEHEAEQVLDDTTTAVDCEPLQQESNDESRTRHSSASVNSSEEKASPSESKFEASTRSEDRDRGDDGGDSSDDDQDAGGTKSSHGRRRKRGARKGRSSSRQQTSVPHSPQLGPVYSHDPSLEQLTDKMRLAQPSEMGVPPELLSNLAAASQNLAREISRATQEKRLIDAKLASLPVKPMSLQAPSNDSLIYQRRGSGDSEASSTRLSSQSRLPATDVRRLLGGLQDSGRTQPTSWRDRNQSSITVSSISSMNSVSSDDVSIYSIASAPAAFARKSSHDSSRQQRQQRNHLGQQSASVLHPISERGKKELDASYLAEIFGGSSSRTSNGQHRRRDPREDGQRRDHHRHDGRGQSSRHTLAGPPPGLGYEGSSRSLRPGGGASRSSTAVSSTSSTSSLHQPSTISTRSLMEANGGGETASGSQVSLSSRKMLSPSSASAAASGGGVTIGSNGMPSLIPRDASSSKHGQSDSAAPPAASSQGSVRGFSKFFRKS